MTQLSFAGDVVLVTGAASGLGLSHARALAERGARVVLNDRVREGGGRMTAEAAAAQLRSEGFEAAAHTGSVGDEAAARAAVELAISKWGRIDILVNNAGNGIAGKVQEVSTAELREVVEVHLFGMFWTMQAALKDMRLRGYGRIINTASSVGAFGAPGMAPYVTAKAAVLGLSRAASLDNRDCDIRVNAICPVARTQLAEDYFRSQPHLDTNKLTPEAVSPVVVYLAHRSCELNGETISAAGGRVARIFTATAPGVTHETLTPEQVARDIAQMMQPDGYTILGSSIEQYKLQPKG